MHLFTTYDRLSRGLSYWEVTLKSGKKIHEGQVCVDFLHGSHNISWIEDIIGSGDNKNILEVSLVTPKGKISIPILEPYTCFQLQRGTTSLLTNEKIQNCQIIGRVDDRDTGACISVIWDNLSDQKLYVDHFTTVKHFAKWREGIADIGPLNYDVVGLRHIGGAS